MDTRPEETSSTERWEKLYSHLKQLHRGLSRDNERLTTLLSEARRVEENILAATKAIGTIKDFANEELQRERSALLNDKGGEIVLDEPSSGVLQKSSTKQNKRSAPRKEAAPRQNLMNIPQDSIEDDKVVKLQSESSSALSPNQATLLPESEE